MTTTTSILVSSLCMLCMLLIHSILQDRTSLLLLLLHTHSAHKGKRIGSALLRSRLRRLGAVQSQWPYHPYSFAIVYG